MPSLGYNKINTAVTKNFKIVLKSGVKSCIIKGGKRE